MQIQIHRIKGNCGPDLSLFFSKHTTGACVKHRGVLNNAKTVKHSTHTMYSQHVFAATLFMVFTIKLKLGEFIIGLLSFTLKNMLVIMV